MDARTFQLDSSSCSYLPDQQSTTEFEMDPTLAASDYEQRMNEGWRKFGLLLFRPVCATCTACRSLRVLVDRFQPDRSQTRAWRRNLDLRVELAPPSVDDQRLELYWRYHQAQADRKGWESEWVDAEEYAFRFVQNTVPRVEVSIWQGEALCAVALTEVTPNCVSAIYHYYDPDLRSRSLGTYIVLRIIELAKNLGKPYVHLGYYVAGCGSLAYKARFRPCEARHADGSWASVDLPIDLSATELCKVGVDF